MMVGILLFVIKLRRKREHEQALQQPKLRNLPDASTLTSSIGQTTFKLPPSSKHREQDQEAVAARDTRIAPEASTPPDRIPEIIALESAVSLGATQPDPEGLLHVSHDSEAAPVSQV